MRVLASKSGVFAAILLLICFSGFTHYLRVRAEHQQVISSDLVKLPMTIGGWHGQDTDKLSERSQDILQLDQYVRRIYSNEQGESVFVYIGYWKRQSGEHQAAKHSPLMCLPANGWKISQPSPRRIDFPAGGGFTVRELSGQEKTVPVLFYYYFFSGTETYLDETEALFHIIHETLFNGRSDGGIVEISTDIKNTGSAEDSKAKTQQMLDRFFADFYPVLSELVAPANPAH